MGYQALVTDVTFSYEANSFAFDHSGAETVFVDALEKVTFDVPQGAAVLLTGRSGSGKSTALRLFNGVIPHLIRGRLTGKVNLDGLDTQEVSLADLGERVATVFQNPRTQFFANTVREELAFARQNAGQEPSLIKKAIDETVHRLQIADWLDRPLVTLSAGELQKVACACALVGGARFLCLDEPTSNLSTTAIEELREILFSLKADGMSLVIAEHRLYYLRDLVDQVVVLDRGHIEQIWDAQDFFSQSDAQRREHGWRVLATPCLANVSQNIDSSGSAGLRVEELTFCYREKCVLDLPNLFFPKGEVSAITGVNGAGKSTLAKVITGLAKPDSGRLFLDGDAVDHRQRLAVSAVVMQDVERQLFSETVRREIVTGNRVSPNIDPDELLASLSLQDVADRHPLSLSGGQKQRLAIAAAIATKARIIVFDEPTSGVDYAQMLAISQELRSLAEHGCIVVVITHDLEFVTECADRLFTLSPYTGKPNQVIAQTIVHSHSSHAR